MLSPVASEAHAPRQPDAAPHAQVGAPAAPSFPGLCDLVDDAWLVLSADGALLGANRAARGRLLVGDTLVVDRGRVVPADPRLRMTWRAALEEARAGRRRLLWSREPGARALSLQPGGPGAPVLVRIGEDDTGRLRRLWAYAHAIGLSAQETRVLEALVDGESPAGIARRHEVGLATVRTQIRGVVTKAGVRGMRELLAQMARVAG